MLTSHNNKIYIYEKNNFIMFHSKYVICYSPDLLFLDLFHVFCVHLNIAFVTPVNKSFSLRYVETSGRVYNR